MKKKVVLLIMDGWGIAPKDKFNAIDNAKTPNVDRLTRDFPDISLRSDGESVGLPEGQYGTSEINHQVIGSGRVVLQDLPKIDKEILDKTFFTNKALVKSCNHAQKNNSALHLVGIVSDGKVHSSINHIISLVKLAKEQGVNKLFIHAFADGRDVPPKSIERFIKEIEPYLDGFKKASIATLQGRFWLDRDRDWEKTETSFKLLHKGEGVKVSNWEAAMNFSYNQGISDEFMTQYLIDEEGLIDKNDSVIFFHYRTDRVHQLLKRTIDQKIENLNICTFIEISESFDNLVAFPRPAINHTLAETVSAAGMTQLHITETEKFTHLTFFLNGGKEKEFEGEEWMLLQSTRLIKPFYNLEPTMQAFKITQEIIKRIEENKTDLIIVNFANLDMVGHTGNYESAVVAAEAIDFCVGLIYKKLQDRLDEYAMIVTADHGNADVMWDYKNEQPHTQHTTNPVPFILISDLNAKLKKRESLEDVAPTILDLMGIEKPQVMTGESLIEI